MKITMSYCDKNTLQTEKQYNLVGINVATGRHISEESNYTGWKYSSVKFFNINILLK